MTTNQAIEAAIGDLAIDPELQPRVDGIDAAHVAALAEDPEGWPPVTVVRDADTLKLVDGFHRLAAAQNLGRKTILAQEAPLPADGDLKGLAFRLNATHGRPLTLSDRRAEAARLLLAHPEWSDRRLGRQVGLAQPTVAKVRSALEAGAQIEQVPARVGADDKSYSYSGPSRQPGELPPQGVVESVGQFFSASERRAQRKAASYLRRVVVAMEDGSELLEEADAAAESARLVLGDDEAADLGERLLDAAAPIAEVAKALRQAG